MELKYFLLAGWDTHLLMKATIYRRVKLSHYIHQNTSEWSVGHYSLQTLGYSLQR